MDEGERQLLKSLVVERRLLALDVAVDGAPYVGQVPELAVERGRLVAGFGHTLNLTAQHLREAAGSGVDKAENRA